MYLRSWPVFCCLFLLACTGQPSAMHQADPVFAIFQRQARQRGFVIDSVLNDGRISIKYNRVEHKVSLDNARKSYQSTGDTSKVEELLVALLNYIDTLPAWNEAAETLTPIVVPADMDFGNAVRRQLTDSTCTVVVRNIPSQLVWVQTDHLKVWKQNQKMLFETAFHNLEVIANRSEVKSAILDGHSYGIVLSEKDHLDSSLPLSPNFKQLVEKKFGWPVYVVMPVRDLCFVFSAKELDFFSHRLGSTVTEEFATSPYPVSRELLKVSDKGVKAIGYFEAN